VRVSLACVGRQDELEVAPGTTLGDLITGQGLHPAPDWLITVNGHRVPTSRHLKDGDLIVYAWPIVGEANVAPGSARFGIEHLRDFTRRATSLTVIDPYLFQCCVGTEAEYVTSFVSATSIDVAPRAVCLIHHPKHITSEIMDRILDACKTHRCSVQVSGTQRVHDRYWICDGTRGLHVGTSLNSLGRRLSTISSLTAQDLNGILHWLRLEGAK